METGSYKKLLRIFAEKGSRVLGLTMVLNLEGLLKIPNATDQLSPNLWEVNPSAKMFFL